MSIRPDLFESGSVVKIPGLGGWKAKMGFEMVVLPPQNRKIGLERAENGFRGGSEARREDTGSELRVSASLCETDRGLGIRDFLTQRHGDSKNISVECRPVLCVRCVLV